MSGKNKIKKIIFEYQGHDKITTKIEYSLNYNEETGKGVDNTVVSDIVMKIEEDKEYKAFDYEKIYTKSGEVNNFKSVFFYDRRTTAPLETDELRKKKLDEIFSKDKDIKNVLLIQDGENIITFENIDTNKIEYRIANKDKSKSKLQNFKNTFFNSNIKTQELDFVNSLHFGYASYGITKNLIEKISQIMAIQSIRKYPDAVEKTLTSNDIPMLSHAFNKYLLNKYVSEEISIGKENKELIETLLKEDESNDKAFENILEVSELLLNKKTMRNFRAFQRALESDEIKALALNNLPLSSEIERLKNIRFDSIIMNLSNEVDLNELSEFYRDNNYGYLVVQDNETEFHSRNLYKVAVEQENVDLSLKASMTKECESLNKIIDLRGVEDIEARTEIYRPLFSKETENVTFITNRIEDMSFIINNANSGSYYKLDDRYLGGTKGDGIYIADVSETSYNYGDNLSFKHLLNVNEYVVANKIIELPPYNPELAPIVNLADAKSRLIEKVIAHKEQIKDNSGLKGRFGTIYKYEKQLTGKQEEFSIANINKEYQIVKKSEEFYTFARQNISTFFKGQLELVFSSLNVAKDKKAFNYGIYYNMPSSISMEQIENSIAAKSYIARSPSGEIVAKIAKKFNINIETTKPFSLSNPEQNTLNVAKKDKVTSLSLGAMKFRYIPKSFELKDEDKEILIDIVESIVKKNKTITEDKLKQDMELFRETLNKSAYMVMKNEHAIVDNTKIAPKEILVLVDEDLKDISKVNVSISEFYQTLEKRKIFKIEDYVEVVKPNSIYLEKIAKNLAKLIGDFRKSQIVNSGINEEIFNRAFTEKTIKIPNTENSYTPEEILISDMPKELKDALLLRFGKALDIQKYYSEFIDFQNTDSLVDWVEKQKIEVNAKNKIINILYQIKGKEIKAFEQNSGVIFPAIQSYLEDNIEMYEKIEDRITKLYHSKKQEEKVVLKTAKLYIAEKMFAKTIEKIGEVNKTYKGEELEKQKELLYPYLKKSVDIVMDDIMGLTKAQREEAVNYSILKEGNLKNTLMTLWEMRTGKTRAAIASVLLTSIIEGNNRNVKRNMMFVQNKNLSDIAEQALDFFPIIAKDIQFNSNDEVSIFKKAKSLELPVNIAKQITPQVIQLLKKQIKFEGQKNSLKSDTVVLARTYTHDMNQIQKEIRQHSLDEIIEIYKDSPFIETLKLAKSVKSDKDIQNSIIQSFVYIQMIYQKNFLSADKNEIVFNKINEFIEKYINAKEQMKDNNLSKIGLDLIPKNLLYSVNVNSQVTNANIKEANRVEKKGSIYLSTPYEVALKNSKETVLYNFSDSVQKRKYEDMVLDSVGMSQRLKDLSDEGKVYRVATSYSDNEILNIKENIASSFVFKSSNDLSSEFITIMDKYIKDNTTDSSLVQSKIYKIDGLDEQIEDTIEVNLNELFQLEKVEDFLKSYENINKDDVKNFTDYISLPDSISSYAKEQNLNYFKEIINPLFDITTGATVKKRVGLISPLLSKKHKELVYGLKVDMELIGDTLVYPVKREMREGKPIYSTNIVNVSHEKIDLFDLSKKIDRDLKGLQLEFGFHRNSPIITVKKDQNPNLMLDNIVKRNENLNSFYTVDLRPDLSNITIDESHKGLKTRSSTLNIHDVTSYIHKIAILNNGTFVIVSGTPVSGKAGDIGRLTTTGVDSIQSELISKDIDKYCTTYEFKDSFDAVLFSCLEAYPEGSVFKAFNETIILPEDLKKINKDSFKLSKETIEGVKEEITKVINNFSNVEQVDKDDIIKERANDYAIASKFEHYRNIFKMEDYIEKAILDKNIKRKTNDVRELLHLKLPLLTKKAPGVYDLGTLAHIIGDISNKNSISISRASDEAKYNILDKDIITKQFELKDTKHIVAVNPEKFKDKTLGISGFMDAYRGRLHLSEIKETLGKIFEAWVTEVFNENNIDKTINIIGMYGDYRTEDINTLISRSGKSVKDSSLDIFNTLYFGSDKEKIEISENKALKDKVDFVVNIIDNFIDFTQNYYEFQNSARVAYEQEKEQALNEERDEEIIYVNNKGLKFEAKKFSELSPIIGSFALFDKSNLKDVKEAITMTNTGEIYIGKLPTVFKTQIEVNNWDKFFDDTLKINYSLTNQGESEILEYLGSNSSTLYTEHLNKGENIRVMSTRNATLSVSFLDTVQSMINREDTSKKGVIILNKNSTKDYNYNRIINKLDKEVLEKANIEIRLTESSTFSAILDEVKKNKNNQIAVVGNYVALAEGIDMSCIDTGFYVGSLRESAETIQSFARQRGYGKEESSFYLGNNGLFERYRLSNALSYEKLVNGGESLSVIAKEIFNGNIKLDNNYNKTLENLSNLTFDKCISSITLSTNATMAKLLAYEAIMSGLYPESHYNYENTNIVSFSDVYTKKNREVEEEIDYKLEEDSELIVEVENHTEPK